MPNVCVTGLSDFKQTHELVIPLAESLSLPVSYGKALSDYDFALRLTDTALQLVNLNEPHWEPIEINFLHHSMRYRLAAQRVLHESLVKAARLKVKPIADTVIIDASAGLAQDAAVLLAAGFQVSLCERSSLIHALLRDAIARYADRIERYPQEQLFLAPRLFSGDARDLIPQVTGVADIIYFDPMYPAAQKSARVKKEMQALHLLLRDPHHEQELTGEVQRDTLAHFRSCAAERVIIKRPNYASWFAEQAPSHQVKSKKHRFDIYLGYSHGAIG